MKKSNKKTKIPQAKIPQVMKQAEDSPKIAGWDYGFYASTYEKATEAAAEQTAPNEMPNESYGLSEEAPPSGNVKAFRGQRLPAKNTLSKIRNAFGDETIEEVRMSGNSIGGYTRKSAYTPSYMEPSVRTEMEDAAILPELADSDAKLPSDIEQFDEVRNSIRIARTPDRTLIYCIVVDKKGEQNIVAGLRCYGGVSFGGYARDVSGDAYLVECVQAVHLGNIPFSFRLEMPKVGNWSVDIPIPEKVLEAAFAPAQRKTLSDLRDRFPDDRYEFQYLQMLLAN